MCIRKQAAFELLQIMLYNRSRSRADQLYNLAKSFTHAANFTLGSAA